VNGPARQRHLSRGGRASLLVAAGVRRMLAVVLACCLSGSVLAQRYRVDDSGGPLTLTEDVAAAAAAWNRVSDEVELEEAGEAEATIRYGDPALMGPDLVSLTLLTGEEEGLEVLIHPGLYREFPAALLHELGLLLGLPAGGSGVMNPALAAGAAGSVGQEEAAALAGLRERVPGDLDGDGRVGLADLAVLGRSYGRRGVNLAADLDGDGVVGSGDVEVMRRAYGFVAPREVEAIDDAPTVGEPVPEGGEPGDTEPAEEPGDR
jgi:hypothetical protein